MSKQLFNTLYQLMAVKKYTPEILTQVSSMLMIPDYFSYLLTGRQVCEYTNASTTQLVSSNTRNWDRELIEQLGYPQTMFKEIIEPGTIIGNLTDIVQESVGFDTKVIATASHDTAVLYCFSSSKRSSSSRRFYLYFLRNMVVNGNGTKYCRLFIGEYAS